MTQFTGKWTFLMLVFIFACFTLTHAGEKRKLAPDTPESDIIRMHPRDVDPSLLPLDKTGDLNRTGVTQNIDINSWKLSITGLMVKGPVEFRYPELTQMPQVKHPVLLICPGFFKDYVQWEGVLLSDVLEKAGVNPDYNTVIIKGKGGYSESFLKKEIDENLIFLALKVNGKVLPKEHGFPLRVVAENIYGGKWVKWVTEIEVR